MGKRTKEHRKKVQARNNRIKQNQQTFMKKFKERFAEEMEREKERMLAENPELASQSEELLPPAVNVESQTIASHIKPE